jgi:hypothetical protein
VSWPPETTPSAAPGPGRPSDADRPTAEDAPSPWAAPSPGHHPPAGQNADPGRPPAEGATGAPQQFPPPSLYPPAADEGTAGRYPAPGQHPATGPTGAPPPYGGQQWTPPAYGTGMLPAGTYSTPPPATPKVRLWPPSRREWTTALTTIAALAILGAAVAPLWVHLAPRLAFRVDQPGRALPVVPEAEEYIAADGRFVIITLMIGVLAGLGCWLLRRSRGPLIMVALAAGGLLGAVVTWRLGMRIGTGYRPEDLQVVGKVLYQPLTLRARAALVVEPTAAVVCYLLAVGFSARNDLGRDEELAASSDSG